MKKGKFDSNGILYAIRVIHREYRLPLPKDCKNISFCSLCLGCNVPNQQRYAKGAWCCGSICDFHTPPLKICKDFKVDREQVKIIAKKIAPIEGKTKVYSVNQLLPKKKNKSNKVN